jgi:hypothetical protein
VGANSAGGSRPLSKTAHESILLDFDSDTDTGKEHFDVIRAFDRMNKDVRIYKNLGGINNDDRNWDEFGENSMPDEHEARGYVNYDGFERDRIVSMRSNINEVGLFYGTDNDDDYSFIQSKTAIEFGHGIESEIHVHGGSGVDIFDPMMNKGVQRVKDFDGDKIKARDTVFIDGVVDENGQPVIRWYSNLGGSGARYIYLEGASYGEMKGAFEEFKKGNINTQLNPYFIK